MCSANAHVVTQAHLDLISWLEIVSESLQVCSGVSKAKGQRGHTHTPRSVKAGAELCRSMHAYGCPTTFFLTLLFLTDVGGAGEEEMKGGTGALKAAPTKQ